MELYDPIRKKTVAATPEEIVRQKLLRKMIGPLGFPKGLISVEAEVGAAGRRADIVCYALMPELAPLVVIECKAAASFVEAEAQAFGYNGALGAPFLCLAGGDELMTLWVSGGRVCKIPYLPTFRELSDAVR